MKRRNISPLESETVLKLGLPLKSFWKFQLIQNTVAKIVKICACVTFFVGVALVTDLLLCAIQDAGYHL